MATVGVTEDRRASVLYETEEWDAIADWLTVLSGFLIVMLAIYLFHADIKVEMPTFRWVTDGAFASTVASSQPAVEKLIKEGEAKRETALVAAAQALKTALDSGDRAAIGTAAKKLGDSAKGAKDAGHVRARARSRERSTVRRRRWSAKSSQPTTSCGLPLSGSAA